MVGSFGRGIGKNNYRIANGNAPTWTPADWGADRLLDYTSDDVVVNAGKVEYWVDQSPSGVNATQTNAALRGAYVASHPALNGKPTVQMTYSPANTVYNRAAIPGVTNQSMFLIIDRIATQAYEYMLYSPVVMAYQMKCYPNLSTIGVYTPGSGHNPITGATQILGAQSLIISVDATGGQVYAYRAGALIGSKANVAGSLNGAIKIFGGGAATDVLRNTHIGRCVVLNRAATVDDIANWSAWTLAEYGI